MLILPFNFTIIRGEITYMSKSDDKSKKQSTKKSSGGLHDAIGAGRKKSRKEVKISRKDMKKDELVEGSAKVIEYLTSHSNQTLYTVGGVIAALLIVVVFNFYTASRRENASELFTSARNLYDLAMNETPPSEVSLKASLEIFNGLINSYKGGSEEALAYFYEGGIYYNLKDYENSINMYDKYLGTSIENSTYEKIAKTNIAYCYKSQGEFDKAIDMFRDISDKSSGYLKESSLFDLGLTLEKAGRKDEAALLYEKFAKAYPESSLIEKVQERINSIQAK